MSDEVMKIQVIDKQSLQLLKSFDLNSEDSAYQFSVEMEKLGLEVDIVLPSVIHQLAQSLGKKGEELKELDESLNEEIEEHPSCMNCPEQSKLS